MSNFVFTPGQTEEALKWYTHNCPDVQDLIDIGTIHGKSVQDILVDLYFKLKNVPFTFKPNEFIVGIEYKDAQKIISGKEIVNVRINNPHKKIADQMTHDEFALAVLYNLFKNSQV